MGTSSPAIAANWSSHISTNSLTKTGEGANEPPLYAAATSSTGCPVTLRAERVPHSVDALTVPVAYTVLHYSKPTRLLSVAEGWNSKKRCSESIAITAGCLAMCKIAFSIMSSAVGEEVNGRVRSTMICAVPTQLGCAFDRAIPPVASANMRGREGSRGRGRGWGVHPVIDHGGCI